MEPESEAPLRRRLLQTALNYFTPLENFNPEVGFPGRTSDFVAKVLPTSIGLPTRTNKELLADHMQMVNIIKLKNYKASIMEGTEPIVDEAKRMVVMQIRVSITTSANEYNNEFAYIMTMNEEASLLKEIVEFVDTAAGRQLAAELAAGRESAHL